MAEIYADHTFVHKAALAIACAVVPKLYLINVNKANNGGSRVCHLLL